MVSSYLKLNSFDNASKLKGRDLVNLTDKYKSLVSEVAYETKDASGKPVKGKKIEFTGSIDEIYKEQIKKRGQAKDIGGDEDFIKASVDGEVNLLKLLGPNIFDINMKRSILKNKDKNVLDTAAAIEQKMVGSFVKFGTAKFNKDTNLFDGLFGKVKAPLDISNALFESVIPPSLYNTDLTNLPFKAEDKFLTASQILLKNAGKEVVGRKTLSRFGNFAFDYTATEADQMLVDPIQKDGALFKIMSAKNADGKWDRTATEILVENSKTQDRLSNLMKKVNTKTAGPAPAAGPADAFGANAAAPVDGANIDTFDPNGDPSKQIKQIQKEKQNTKAIEAKEAKTTRRDIKNLNKIDKPSTNIDPRRGPTRDEFQNDTVDLFKNFEELKNTAYIEKAKEYILSADSDKVVNTDQSLFENKKQTLYKNGFLSSSFDYFSREPNTTIKGLETDKPLIAKITNDFDSEPYTDKLDRYPELLAKIANFYKFGEQTEGSPEYVKSIAKLKNDAAVDNKAISMSIQNAQKMEQYYDLLIRQNNLLLEPPTAPVPVDSDPTNLTTPNDQTPLAKSKGGMINYLATGGNVPSYRANPNPSYFKPKGTDTVPAMLSPGEFVINAGATAKHSGLLSAINSGKDVGYSATGGMVYLEGGGDIPNVAPKQPQVNKNSPQYIASIQKQYRDKFNKDFSGSVDDLFLWGEILSAPKIKEKPEARYKFPTQDIPYPADAENFKVMSENPIRQVTKQNFENQETNYNSLIKKFPDLDIGKPVATGLVTHFESLKEAYPGVSDDELKARMANAQKYQEESSKNPSPGMKTWDRYNRSRIDYGRANEKTNLTITDGITKSPKKAAGFTDLYSKNERKSVYVSPRQTKANRISTQEHETAHSISNADIRPESEGLKSLKQPKNKYYTEPPETIAHMENIKSIYFRETGKHWEGDIRDLLNWGNENNIDEHGFKGFQGAIDEVEENYKKDNTNPSPDSIIEYLNKVKNSVVKGENTTKDVNYSATGGMAYLEDGAMVNPFMQFAKNTTGRKKQSQSSGFDPAAAAIRAMQIAKEEEERPEKERKALEAMRIALPKKEYLEQEKNFRESTMNRASQKFDPETQLRMDENDAQDIKALHYLGYMGAGAGMTLKAPLSFANNLSAHGVKSSFGHLGKEIAGEIGTEAGIMGTEKSGGFLTNKLIGRSAGGPVSYLKLGGNKKSIQQFNTKAGVDFKKLMGPKENPTGEDFAELMTQTNNLRTSNANFAKQMETTALEQRLIGDIGTSNSAYAAYGSGVKRTGDQAGQAARDAALASADQTGIGVDELLAQKAITYTKPKEIKEIKEEKKEKKKPPTRRPLDPPTQTTETTTTEPPLSGDPETRKKQQEDKIEKAAAEQRKKDAIAEEQIQRKKDYDAKIEARRQQAIENGRLQARLNAGGNAIPAAPAIGQAGAAAGVLGQQVMGGIQAGAGMLGNIMGGLNPLGQAGAGAGAVGAGIANPTTNLLEQLQNYFSENFIQLSSGGKSTATSDTIPAMLTPGEFVVNARSSAKNASLLHDINSGKDIEGFATGGSVGYYSGGKTSGGGSRASDRLSSAASKLSEAANKLSDAASKINPSQTNVNPIVNSRDSSSFVEIKGSSFDKLTQVLNSGFRLEELSSVLKTEIRINQSDMGQLLGSMGTFGSSIGSFSTAVDKFSSSATNFNTNFVAALTNFNTYISDLKAAAALIPTTINVKGNINTNVSVGMDATTIQFAVQQVVQDVSDEMKRMINDAIDRTENGI